MRLGGVGQAGANGYYRLVLPLMAMRERGHDVVHVVQEVGTPIDIAPLRGCDYVHIHRPALLYDDGEVVTRLLDAGVVVGFDEDDNILDAPETLAEIAEIPWLERSRRNFELFLEHCHRANLVTTPSDHLADRFEAAGALVIGWHAGREHRLDAEALGVPETLARLLDAHDDVHVVTIDVDLGLGHARYRCEEAMPLEQLTQRLADFDVGLVPLADSPAATDAPVGST